MSRKRRTKKPAAEGDDGADNRLPLRPERKPDRQGRSKGGIQGNRQKNNRQGSPRPAADPRGPAALALADRAKDHHPQKAAPDHGAAPAPRPAADPTEAG